MEALAGGIVGDHRLGAALEQELAHTVAVISDIASAPASGQQRCEQYHGDADVAALAWGYRERDGPATAVDDGMDLRRATCPYQELHPHE
jgi:hypothetical protein